MGRMRLVFYPFMVNRVIKIGRMIIKYWEREEICWIFWRRLKKSGLCLGQT